LAVVRSFVELWTSEIERPTTSGRGVRVVQPVARAPEVTRRRAARRVAARPEARRPSVFNQVVDNGSPSAYLVFNHSVE
jgi:hypothetical protein